MESTPFDWAGGRAEFKFRCSNSSSSQLEVDESFFPHSQRLKHPELFRRPLSAQPLTADSEERIHRLSWTVAHWSRAVVNRYTIPEAAELNHILK